MTDHKPFWTNTPLRTARRGHFWISGERVAKDGLIYEKNSDEALQSVLAWLDTHVGAGGV